MKNKIPLFLIILISLFFYLFNLRYTYFFSGDVARDTLASLRILKNKEITVIGPPLSFGQYGTREIYFGSLTYYFGALGLWLTKNDVLGPVYINIFLMIVGILSFYKLSQFYIKNKYQALLATCLYAFIWYSLFILDFSRIKIF